MQGTPPPRPGPSRAALAAMIFAALTGAGAVGLGAMAAHGLDAEPARLAGIAARYGLAHAAALIGAALVFDHLHGWARRLSGLALALFAIGISGFCGGLTALAFGVNTGSAPYGGMALIGAWITLALGAAFALCRRNAPARQDR